jgi:simple sugar transport system ATP-binding protein
MEAIIELKNIVKQFPGVLANDHVSLQLFPGECHALVGENGAGKSTLMKILYGAVQPDEGEILIDGKACSYDIQQAREYGIGMVYQNFMQVPEMSILENVILGNPPKKGVSIDYKTAEDKVSQLMKRFGLKANPKTPIKRLSVGERQKLEIIKTLYFGARVLILDEPTAVLTPQEAEELFKVIDNLKAEGKAVVFISHKLREVVRVGDRITVMRHGKIVKDGWLRGDADETAIAREMIGKKDVELVQNNRRFRGAGNILDVEHLWYFDQYGIAKLKDVTLRVEAGEILGVGGVDGNGQSELINILIGLLRQSFGTISVGGNDVSDGDVAARRKAGIGFISEDRMTVGLVLDGTIEDNVIAGNEYDPRFSHGIVLKKKEITEYCHELINNYSIFGMSDGKKVGELSGGNMQKIILAREIEREPKILIAAQPTRGLDIGATNFVRDKLLEEKNKGTAIILVSADLEELMSLSDRMVIFYEGRIHGEITDVAGATEEQIGLLMGGA